MTIALEDIDRKPETRFNNPIVIERPVQQSNYWDLTYLGYAEPDKSYLGKYFLKDCEEYLHKIRLENEDPSTHLNFDREELPSYFERNFEIIQEAFIKEVETKKLKKSQSFALIQETFTFTAKIIAELDFESATVEVVSLNKIKFVLLFHGNTILMISKSLYPDKHEFNSNEIIYSLFINRKLITSDVSEIPAFTKGFKEYLTM